MENIEGYKLKYEKKKNILYCRMDESMIQRLKKISKKTGISSSELTREAIRRLLHDIDLNGSIQLKLN